MIMLFYFSLIITGGIFQNGTMPDGIERLEKLITEKIESVDGTFALAFRDLQNPDNYIFINEKESFHAASTMKTPVMIEAFRQAANGVFSLSDSITVKNEFTSIVDGSTFSISIDRDSGDRFYTYLGKQVPIRDLIHDMITMSGNLATNLVIDLVGAENVSATMRDLGAMDIRVLRGVEDMKAFEQGLNNTTTAYDLLLIYEAIAHNEIISADACREMIAILSDQKFRDKIPGHLPNDVHVAHKTGSITGVQHDSGIVYLPDGRAYTIVILSKNLKSGEDGVKVIADVSRLIFDWMMSVPAR